MIERLISEHVDNDAERHQAEAVARKRLGEQWDGRQLGRVLRLLLGRGYGFEVVDDVLRVIAGNGDEEADQSDVSSSGRLSRSSCRSSETACRDS